MKAEGIMIAAVIAALVVSCSKEPNQQNGQAVPAAAKIPSGKIEVLKPVQAEAEKVLAAIEAAGKGMTFKEQNAANDSEEGQKAALKKLMVDPWAKVGYDFEGSIKSFAKRLKDGDVTQDEAQVVMGVLALYKDNAEKLAKWGFISAETRDLLSKAF